MSDERTADETSPEERAAEVDRIHRWMLSPQSDGKPEDVARAWARIRELEGD